MMSDWTDSGSKHYRAETDWLKIREKWTKEQQGIKTKGVLGNARFEKMIDRVRSKLCELGVNPEFMGFYFAYAEALYKSQIQMGWMVDRIREHQILRDRWETRGLKAEILDELDKILIFNKTAP
jgi:hypothetical protein